jgi:hypothetical protein
MLGLNENNPALARDNNRTMAALAWGALILVVIVLALVAHFYVPKDATATPTAATQPEK